MNADTIVAIATPPGFGGVGIIRLSGPDAYQIAIKLSDKSKLKPRTAHFSNFYDAEESVIDQGLVLFFPSPNSFTGEDVVELQTHGSPVVLDQLMLEACSYGARIAKPGEFSERAFLNDKMDLTQAEAIADLIHATSTTAARMAVRSLQGDFSKRIQALSEKIVYLRLYVEAAIDFPEEEIDFLADGKVEALLTEIHDDLASILVNASQGALVREGLSIVIAGKPNAGKSTLINALSGKDVAIVTDIAGTTRDVMRELVLLDGLPMHLIDTAGLHDSEDPVEKEGIKRAWHEVEQADCVLLMIDADQIDKKNDSLGEEVRKRLPTAVPVIKVYNKIDRTNHKASCAGNNVYISAQSGEGLNLLINKIKQTVGYKPTEGQFLARRRHLDSLKEAQTFLAAGEAQLKSNRAGELLAEDLRLAHLSLCNITGEFTSDDLLGEIFSSFCIGK